ncbi:MAG: teicoplanin resistance protein VanZ [Chlorobiaceae bacterium]|nr:teicoplanin resistance protein VanZ [Chlorobiaceae bacterium]
MVSIHLRHFIRYQFPAIGWALLIFIGSSIPSKYFPPSSIFTFDKLIHAFLFFVLGVFVYRALTPYQGRHEINWRRLIISVVIVVGYGILDELHQGFVPGRTLDFYDGIADTIGGLLAAALIVYLAKYKKTIKI